MQEEFHGIWEPRQYQQLYGWGTMHVNVWLPSLSELVGVTGIQDASKGTYFSAMQGLNASTNYYVDLQGGAQFAYFKQFNASGGGEKLWVLGGSEQLWTRSSVYTNQLHAWRITNAQRFDYTGATVSHAVHPAGDTGFKVSFWLYPPI